MASSDATGTSARAPAKPLRVLVTGGAGFIGSALVRHVLSSSPHEVLNFDKLTYAASSAATGAIEGSPKYRFIKGDVCDKQAISEAFASFQPDVVAHLAAESHVDRSIDSPDAFIQTNLVGTYVLLEAARAFWNSLDSPARVNFRFLHVSTDEVFGSLGSTGHFCETTPYDPRSPYSASKAGSDHLVRAWGHTYGLPILITNSSNNYGPFQFPEKLIPLMIVKALAGEILTVFGTGDQIRDWLYVDDHVRALRMVFESGQPGRTYSIGGNTEKTNLEVVGVLVAILDRLAPRCDGRSYSDQIGFVEDRPGHDARYAIDASRIRDELGWSPREKFESAVEKTVEWYLDNQPWWRVIVAEHQADRRRGLGGYP